MTPTKNSINHNDIFFIVMIDMHSKCHSMYFKWTYSGADPGFQVRGGALKKIAPSGGRRENFWGISCEK